jgi:hypothetical protein
MNKVEVIRAIEIVGRKFSNVMAELCGDEFAAGYRRAIFDMTELISKAPMEANFEAEREAMLAEIKRLVEKNAALEQEVREKHATIQKLLSHVNLAEVVGVKTKKRENPKKQRAVFFLFK